MPSHIVGFVTSVLFSPPPPGIQAAGVVAANLGMLTKKQQEVTLQMVRAIQDPPTLGAAPSPNKRSLWVQTWLRLTKKGTW